MSNEKTAPTFILKLNNTRIPPEKEASIKEITIISMINDASKFMILFNDPQGEWIDSDDTKIGVKVEISLGYKDNVTSIIKGEITGITAGFSRVFGRTVQVTGYDAVHKLAKVKTTKSFLEKSYSDAIKEIIQARSLQCDVCDLGGQRLFIVQKDQTDLEFIHEAANQFDLTLKCKGEKIIIEEFTATKNEDVTLEWNKTLIKFNPVSNVQNVFTDLNLYCYNGRKMEGVKAEKTSGDSQSDDLKRVAEKIGSRKEYVISRDVFEKNDADKIALKRLKMNSRKYVNAEGTASGDPLIIGGTVIKAKGIPKRWDRMYHVVCAKHILRPNRGYITEFSCELYTGKQLKFGGQKEAGSSDDKKTQESGNASAANETNENETPQETSAMSKSKENKAPQLKNLKWKDKDNKDISKAHVGDKVKLTAAVTDIDDDTSVNVKIFEKDDDGNNDLVTQIGVRVKNGKIETEWDVVYMADEDDANSAEEKGYTLPEYIFVMECSKYRIEGVESGVLEVKDWIELLLKDWKGAPLKNNKYILKDNEGNEKSGNLDNNGYAKIDNLVPNKKWTLEVRE